MVPRHTKFSCDRALGNAKKAYNNSGNIYGLDSLINCLEKG